MGGMDFKGHAPLPRGEREEGLGGGTPPNRLNVGLGVKGSFGFAAALPTTNPEFPQRKACASDSCKLFVTPPQGSILEAYVSWDLMASAIAPLIPGNAPEVNVEKLRTLAQLRGCQESFASANSEIRAEPHEDWDVSRKDPTQARRVQLRSDCDRLAKRRLPATLRTPF
jgi:hypothetical protein